MTLGEKIKLTRMQKKLSQQQLADKAKIHQKNISKYESNDVVPSAITLKAIADALEVTTDYLLGSDKDIAIKDTALFKQFKAIDNMPDKEKNALVSVISAYIMYHKTKKAYAS
jgi:transcriptional regulator with XRE-family HTH domain